MKGGMTSEETPRGKAVFFDGWRFGDVQAFFHGKDWNKNHPIDSQPLK